MKKLRILRMVLHKTRADRLVLSFLAFLMVTAAVLWVVEPNIPTYRDALWYCYAVISVNLKSAFNFTRLVAPIMAKQRSGSHKEIPLKSLAFGKNDPLLFVSPVVYYVAYA